MKFFCLCAAPAIDAFVRLDRAPRGEGEIFKGVVDVENAGGKALNVARWLALRGADVACGGWLGEENAAVFERELARSGVTDRFNRVPGATRRNEVFAWPDGSFKVNRAAFPDRAPGAFAVIDAWRGVDELCAGDMAVLSGSLPAAFAPSFYAEAIVALRARGVRTALDASGEALRLGVAARPDLIKPNAEECAAVLGYVPSTPDEFRRATDELRAQCAHVVISDGAAGAWFDGEFVPAPRVEAVDATAAGDTLLAEYCLTGDARRAVAAGSAACTMPGSTPPSLAAFERLAHAGDIA